MVQAAHPCPAAAAAVSHAAHGQGHHGAPADGGHDAQCRCIGSCQVAAAAQASDAATLEVAFAAHHPTPPGPDGALLLPAGRPPQLLPPATAPPILS